MQILSGAMVRTSTTSDARGGTELLAERLLNLPKEVLEPYQIVFSRPDDVMLLDDKIRILYCHDLASDPGVDSLANEGWKRFHHLVFVSYWQRQQFLDKFNIPHSVTSVIQNSINPIEVHEKPEGKLKLAYWSTPHRGLNVLLPVFDALYKEKYDIELDIYSSFDLYGWEDRDAGYKDLIDFAKNHEAINYSKSIPNEDLREKLKDIHILAYPSCWMETSCLVLIEAMSAGILPVHSDLGALPETSGNQTVMYPYKEDPNQHAQEFYQALKYSLDNYTSIKKPKAWADAYFNWEYKKGIWNHLLTREDLLSVSRPLPGKSFIYKV